VKRFLCRLFRRASVKAAPPRPLASSPYRVAPPRLPEPVVAPTRVRFARAHPRPQGNLSALLVILQVAVGVVRLCTEASGPTRLPTSRFNASWSPAPPVGVEGRRPATIPTAVVRSPTLPAASAVSTVRSARAPEACKKPLYCRQ